MQRLSFPQLSSCQVSTGAVAMHHLSGFYVDSGDLSRGSHANTANVLSAGALSRAPFFLCLKKNVSSGDQTQVLGIARPALLLSSLASSWSLVFTLRMVLNTTQRAKQSKAEEPRHRKQSRKYSFGLKALLLAGHCASYLTLENSGFFCNGVR